MSLCKLIKEDIEFDIKTGDNYNFTRKPFNRKPYWNKELKELWQFMHKAENMFLNCANNYTERKKLLETFKNSQNRFNKRYRFYKRRYQRGQVLNLKRI